MAGNHPIHVHPVRPLYRFAATALGASMWFFVCITCPGFWLLLSEANDINLVCLAHVSGEEGWPCFAWVETSLGPLNTLLPPKNDAQILE